MNRTLSLYAKSQGFEDLEQAVKDKYVTGLLNDINGQKALESSSFTSNPEALLTLTGVSFKEFEYGILCSYFLAQDKHDVVRKLKEDLRMDVPKESIKGAQLRYIENKDLKNLESLKQLKDGILYFESEPVQQMHAEYLSASNFRDSARLAKITGVAPKKEDLYEALERKLL